MKRRSPESYYQTGLSYVEVLVTVMLIALTAIPATDAIRGAINGSEIDSRATANQYRLKSKLEEVLADPFITVASHAAGPATATAYSDPIGTIDRRLVLISTYDGDNGDTDDNPFTGMDPDLLWVRVEIEGSVRALQALRGE